MVRTDEQIKVDIVNELEWNSSVDASDVKVTVENGEATLTGTVNFYSISKAAESSAFAIPGVKAVNNQLTVSYPDSIEMPSDEEIKNSADNVILWDTDVYSFEIDVSVDKGIVTLEGTVDAYWKKLHAERLITPIMGVISVINRLAVVPSADVEDKLIADDIMSAINRLQSSTSDEIYVEVDGGHVTLSGTVSSWLEKRAIENAAEYTAGVIDVKSFLSISI
ncbi:MAG: BON domain-containing protein [Patescibacteria group bacterium]